jgi:hypothetical protein
MFWLTMSGIISMKFSMITCRSSSLRLFLWTLLGSLVSFIFVFWSPKLGICFLHFLLNPVLNYFGGKNGFHPFLSFHHSTWYCAIVFLIGQLVVSVTCFLSLDLIFVFWLSWVFIYVCVYYFCPWSGCNSVLTKSQV